MESEKLSVLWRKSLVESCENLRDHTNRADFAPLLMLFIALKVWLTVLIQFVESFGGSQIRTGVTFDDPVSVEKLDFYSNIQKTDAQPVGGTVTQANVEEALRLANSDYIPSFLNFSADTSPLLGWIFLIALVVGYATPLGYALYSFLEKSPPNWVRRIFQIVVLVCGVFWGTAMFNTGIQVANPINSIESAGFWMLYGALCLSLFTDCGTKARRWMPFACIIILLAFSFLRQDFVIWELFSTKSFVPFAEETNQINAAFLTNWWSDLYGFLKDPDFDPFWWVLGVYLLLNLSWSFLKPKINKTNAFISLFMEASSVAILVFLICAMLGMRIETPATIITFQCLAMFMGMAFLNYASDQKAYDDASKEFLENQISRLVKPTEGKTL